MVQEVGEPRGTVPPVSSFGGTTGKFFTVQSFFMLLKLIFHDLFGTHSQIHLLSEVTSQSIGFP